MCGEDRVFVQATDGSWACTKCLTHQIGFTGGKVIMDSSDEDFDFDGSLDDNVYDGRPECTVSGFCRIDKVGGQYHNCGYCIKGIPNPDPLENGLDYEELSQELNSEDRGDQE